MNINSLWPKEIVISRRNGTKITIEVEYPWLPAKCKIFKGFGHAAFACAKIEQKVWKPRDGQKKIFGREEANHQKNWRVDGNKKFLAGKPVSNLQEKAGPSKINGNEVSPKKTHMHGTDSISVLDMTSKSRNPVVSDRAISRPNTSVY
jgi:hypothetical protein